MRTRRRDRRAESSGAWGGAGRGTARPAPVDTRGGSGPARRAQESVEAILARQPWPSLHGALRAAGAEVGAADARLRAYARRLVEWNRNVSNIMSSNDEERIVERHFVESVAPAYWLRASGCSRWVDFGSGAGFPAIPLVIAGVGGSWTLVESRRMKTLFLRKTILDMQLRGMSVVNARLENFAAEPGRASAYDGFVSRATLRLGPTLALATTLIKRGGSAFLWKGSRREREMEEDPAWRETWEFTGLLGVGTGPNVVVRFDCNKDV